MLLDECGLNGVLKHRILDVLRALSFALLPPDGCEAVPDAARVPQVPGMRRAACRLRRRSMRWSR